MSPVAAGGGGLVILMPNYKKIQASLKRWPKKSLRAMKAGWRPVDTDVHRKLIRVTSRNLQRRTGALARGWARPRSIMSGNTLQVHFINETEYAVTHEYGATIVAKNARFLTIPLGAAKTAGGVARVSARDLPSRQTFVTKGVIFFKRSKRDPRPLAMFALKESVTIPPRLNAWGVIMASERKYIKATEQAISRLWDKG